MNSRIGPLSNQVMMTEEKRFGQQVLIVDSLLAFDFSLGRGRSHTRGLEALMRDHYTAKPVRQVNNSKIRCTKRIVR